MKWLGKLRYRWRGFPLGLAGLGVSLWIFLGQGMQGRPLGGGAISGGAMGSVAGVANSGRQVGLHNSAVINVAQAEAITAKETADLTTTANALTSQVNAQNLAYVKAMLRGNVGGVTDGYNSANGLVPISFYDAHLVSSTGNDVIIQQDAPDAVISWSSFNIGVNTTLTIDQSTGGPSGSNSWISLNRVIGRSLPSLIEGQITAQGTVYIINQNGITFTGSSRVNVDSLLASTLAKPFEDDLVNGVQQTQLVNGVEQPIWPSVFSTTTDPSSQVTSPNGLVQTSTTNGVPISQGVLLVANPDAGTAGSATAGDVNVQAGASIKTGNLGFAILAGHNVTNHGTLTGRNIMLLADQQVKIVAPDLQPTQQQLGTNTLTLPTDFYSQLTTSDAVGGGTALNTGLIQAPTGSIYLQGNIVQQAGVVESTVSVLAPGSIVLQAIPDDSGNLGAVLLGNQGLAADDLLTDSSGNPISSVTAILPEENGQTTTSSSSAIAAVVLGNLTVQGNSVWVQNRALIEAPSAGVNIGAILGNGSKITIPYAHTTTNLISGRVYLDAGSIIDVAGLPAETILESTVNGLPSYAVTPVSLSAAETFLTLPPLTANELANSPLNRTGALIGQSVTVDTSMSGVDANGFSWVGSPILNISSNVTAIPLGIDQLLINGGQINLAGTEVIAAPGSTLNLMGGYTHYTAATVHTTNLLGADGRIYNISNVNPNVPIVGIAGQFIEDYAFSKWGISETYNGLLHDTSPEYISDYIQGGNGGALNVGDLGAAGANSSKNEPGGGALILNGEIYAQALPGRNQVASGNLPFGGTFNYDPNGSTPINNFNGIYDVAIASGDIVTPTLSNLVGLTSTSTDPANNQVVLYDPTAAAAAGLIFNPTVGVSDLVPQTGSQSQYSSMPSADITNPSYWIAFSTPMFNNADFSGVSISTLRVAGGGYDDPNHHDSIALLKGANLTVQPGGSIRLEASTLTILGSLTAHSGKISLVQGPAPFSNPNNNDLYEDYSPLFGPLPTSYYQQLGISDPLTSGLNESSVNGQSDPLYVDGTLDVSGQWVNDAGANEDQIGGGAYLNGGSIGIKSNSIFYNEFINNTYYNYDDTAPILLQPGTKLNVSGGGRILPSGQLQLANNGLPSGMAGNLEIGVGIGGVDVNGYGVIPPADNQIGQVGYLSHGTFYNTTSTGVPWGGATVLSNGFSGGGTLTLDVEGLQIGSTPEPSLPGSVYTTFLSPNFFAQQGFSNYVLNSNYDVLIASDANIHLTHTNLLLTGNNLYSAPSGIDVNQANYTSVSQVPLFQRTPTNLTVNADLSPSYNIIVNPPNPQLLVDSGAVIAGEAGAAIALHGIQTTILGSIQARGGSISLTSSDTSGNNNLVTLAPEAGIGVPNFSVWLGSDSSLDVSGTFVQNDQLAPVIIDGQRQVPIQGQIYAGGVVNISGPYIVAEPTSTINISGFSATEDVTQTGVISAHGLSLLSSNAAVYAPMTVWSDAGSINLAVGTINGSTSSGLWFNSQIHAFAGNPLGNGGTLSVGAGYNILDTRSTVPRNKISLQQQEVAIPDSAVSSFESDNLNTGIFYLSAANVNAATGLATLNIGTAAAPLPVVFNGGSNFQLRKAINIYAPKYTFMGTPDTVTLTAPYINLGGADYNAFDNGELTDTPSGTAGNLDINANVLDLTGYFDVENFGQLNLTGSSAIRFNPNLTPITEASSPTAAAQQFTAANLSGQMNTNANLLFTSDELYPTTGTTYTIQTTGSGGITVNNYDALPIVTPLSAGGGLVFNADQIAQNGTVLAPSGTIILGITSGTSLSLASGSVASVSTANSTVTLGGNSLTSVSLNGATIPYGTTSSGLDWEYTIPGSPNGSVPDLTQAPQKVIQIGAATVNLGVGGVINLTGGGDLQAQEWVPGPGGSRDYLNATNIVYSSGVPTTSSLYNNNRNVYAIIPGYNLPVSANDPALSLTPVSVTTGGVTTTTEQVNQPMVGESVTLSGVGGLPTGTYTLLPGTYATVPGAYRVVVDSAGAGPSGNATAVGNTVMNDGTYISAGYFGNNLTGGRQAISEQFDVQQATVWQKYSQYTFSSANTYFPVDAVRKGIQLSPLPMDAGRLSLDVTKSLNFGSTLLTSAAPGGAGAEVDIAVPGDIIINNSGGTDTTATTYLTTSELNSLGAGSLLVGGYRTNNGNGSGTTITEVAQSIDLTAQSLLYGPEITLVASKSLTMESGSEIEAEGSYPATRDVAITIGSSSSAGSGDGSLIRVSNGQDVSVTRLGVTTTHNLATLTLEPGAIVTGVNPNASNGIPGAQALTLNTSGSASIDPSVTLAAQAIDVTANAIQFGGVPTNGTTVLSGQNLLNIRNARSVAFRSYSTINFDNASGIVLNTGSLDLSAPLFTTNGLDVNGSTSGSNLITISAPTVTLSNELEAAAPTTDPNAGVTDGQLDIQAQEVRFGTGQSSLSSSFQNLTLVATSDIMAAGQNYTDPVSQKTEGSRFNFGSVSNVVLQTPEVVAGNASNVTLISNGSLSVVAPPNPTAAPDLSSILGGSITLQAAEDVTIGSGVKVTAPGGVINLHSKGGNVVVSGAALAAEGAYKIFFDYVVGSNGGQINLTSDTGSIAANGATFDVTALGGSGGSVDLSAASGNVDLTDANLEGSGGTDPSTGQPFAGGSITINSSTLTGDLDLLADRLLGKGFTSLVSVTASQDLTLNSSLTAKEVDLTSNAGVNGGLITINGTIDASGNNGGTINLYGSGGVDLTSTGYLNASGTVQGGNVTLGTSGTSNGLLDSTYGYEQVTKINSGTLNLRSGSRINVTGGTANGTITLRAPILSDHTVNVTNQATVVTGPSGTTPNIELDAYAVWSKGDGGAFDGYIDPAGWVNNDGTMVAGTFYDQNGNPVATVASGTLTEAQALTQYFEAGDYFYTSTPNTAHTEFFSGFDGGFDHFNGNPSKGSIPYFVQQAGGVGPLYDGLVVHPEVDLVNPTGDVNVVSPWNLAAVFTLPNATPGLPNYYRVLGLPSGAAPIITIRAAGNVNINSSISDGFVQYATSISSSSATLADGGSEIGYVGNAPSNFGYALPGLFNVQPTLYGTLVSGNSSSYIITAGANTASADPNEVSTTAIGDINLDGHTTFEYNYGASSNPFSSSPGITQAIYSPTTVRTGTGSITMNASHDILFSDKTAPATVYSAGQSSNASHSAVILIPNSAENLPILLSIDSGYASGGGNVALNARNDIIGVQQIVDSGSGQTQQSLTGNEVDAGQLWWQWMGTSATFNSATQSYTNGINFSAFDQGVLSMGGNIKIQAGQDIDDLSVSLPTVVGANGNILGGNNQLTVQAGRDILSGIYFVSHGTAIITAGRNIVADPALLSLGQTSATPNGMILGMQDAQLMVSAGDSLHVAGIFNPSSYDAGAANPYTGNGNYLGLVYSANSSYAPSNLITQENYSDTSSVTLTAANGDLTEGDFTPSAGFNKLSGTGFNLQPFGQLLPPKVTFEALNGGIFIDSSGELVPSARGNLTVIAANSVQISGASVQQTFGLLDYLGTNLNQGTSIPDYAGDYDPNGLLHAGDTTPVRIYSLNGDITDVNQTDILTDKPAFIHAGHNVVNLTLTSQNNAPSDITLIQAGNDILDNGPANIQLGGPGTVELIAGRNVGPFYGTLNAYQAALANQNLVRFFPEPYGVETVGNANNPTLSHDGADIAILFGVAPGLNISNASPSDLGFAQTFLDPNAVSTAYNKGLSSFTYTSSGPSPTLSGELMSYVTKFGDTPTSAADAYKDFLSLSQDQQIPFIAMAFNQILAQVTTDYENPASTNLFYHDYARGYAAVNTLFPGSLGYTQNSFGSGKNGAQALIQTGDLNLEGATIQTERGGQIQILGPGGRILVGSSGAPPEIVSPTTGKIFVGPDDQGLLTLEGGGIGTFSDNDVLVAQSRIETQEGGDITMWSSNGSIDAGSGAKTTSEIPPATILFSPFAYATVDQASQVSGAGIAALQPDPSIPQGNVILAAPVGTIDFGEAGVRAKNLIAAAARFANAFNVTAKSVTGTPVAAGVNTGSLNAGSSAAGGAFASAKIDLKEATSRIEVQVIGYGGGDQEPVESSTAPNAGASSTAVNSAAAGAAASAAQGDQTKKQDQGN